MIAEGAAAVVEVLAAEARRAHRVVVGDARVLDVGQTPTAGHPAVAEFAVFGSGQGERLVEAADVQKGRTRKAHVVGRQEDDFATIEVAAEVVDEKLAGLGVGILRSAVCDPAAETAGRLGKVAGGKGAQPSGLGRAVVVGKGDEVADGRTGAGVAGGGRAGVVLFEQAHRRPVCRRLWHGNAHAVGDDQDFVATGGILLGGERRQAAAETRFATDGGDDDREEGELAGAGGRIRRGHPPCMAQFADRAEPRVARGNGWHLGASGRYFAAGLQRPGQEPDPPMTSDQPERPADGRPRARSGRILRNAGFLTAGAMVQRVIGFATAIVLARSLGTEQFGVLGIATAFTGFLRIAVRSGIGPTAIREIARNPDTIRRLVRRILGLRLVISTVTLVVVLAALDRIAPHLGVPPLILGLYSTTLIPEALRLGWVFRGLERMNVVAYINVLERALVLVGLVVLLAGPDPAMWKVPAVETAAAFAVVATFLWMLRRDRLLTDRGSAPIPGWGSLFGETSSITAATFLRSIYIDGHVVLLGIAASPEAAGLFLVSHKLMLSATMLQDGLQQAAFPLTSRLALTAPAEAVAYQARMLRIVLALLVPVALAVTALASPLIELLYGPAYGEAAAVLRLAIWTLPFLALTGAHRALLLAGNAAGNYLGGTAVGAAAHLALGIAAIPVFGALGAAAACLAGEAVAALVMARLARMRFGSSPLSRATLAPFVAGSVAAVPLAIPGWPPLLAVAVALPVYLVAALLLRATDRREILAGLASLRDAARPLQ